MTTVNPFLSSHLKSASVCAPTDPVSPASPGRKGWNAGARQLPAHTFRFSTKMPACGFDSDSQKLLRDLVKDVRAETDVNYAKIGQCNEDCLYKRATDASTYPSHIYDRSKMLVLMHGVLGLPEGRFFESTGAKANDKLQDVRLNQQLEPIEMVNHLCAGTLDRPIAICMMPVVAEYDGRSAQLTEVANSHDRACADAKRKDPTDMQQEGEDDETHDLRLKLLRSQRCSQANIDESRGAAVPVAKRSKPDVVPKPPRQSRLSMAQFDATRNKLLGSWSKTPSPTEHRAQVESRYLIEAIKDQLGDDAATERPNAITGPYAFHTVLSKLSKPGSGLTGFPAYSDAKRAAALQQAVKDRWLCKPPAHRMEAEVIWHHHNVVLTRMEISSSVLHHFASVKPSGSVTALSVAEALSILHSWRVVRRSHFASGRNIRRLLNVCVRLFRVSSECSVCLPEH